MIESDKGGNAVEWLREQGKCSSRSTNGYLCTISANHHGRRHETQTLGGPDDGLVLETWNW